MHIMVESHKQSCASAWIKQETGKWRFRAAVLMLATTMSCLLCCDDTQFGDISNNISKELATSISRVEVEGSSILYSNAKRDHYLGPSVVLHI